MKNPFGGGQSITRFKDMAVHRAPDQSIRISIDGAFLSESIREINFIDATVSLSTGATGMRATITR